MKNIVVLGAGTAGTMAANKLVKQKRMKDWKVTVIDKDNRHHYQPGFLFIPFGMVPAKRVTKSRKKFLPKGIDFIQEDIVQIDRDEQVVVLESGERVPYDQLIVATGTVPRPDQVPGMSDGKLWYDKVFDFYTYEGSVALKPALESMKRGRLVVNICEMPIKCPVAPLEFALLAQDFMRKKGLGFAVDVVFVTPLDGAFTKPVASEVLGNLLAERGIEVVTDFQIESVDNDAQEIVSYDGRRVPFDLLVTIPPNRGVKVAQDSGLSDDAGFIEVDKHTLRSVHDPNIWSAGDATNCPTSKAGSVAHFEMDSLIPNIVSAVHGEPLTHSFDGHANCFIESGRGEALLLDFNYDQEPLPGVFKIYGIPALKLLGPSYANHAAKMGFELVYWDMLLPGRPLPFPSDLSMDGKKIPENYQPSQGH